jgi:hypothetical protein
MTRLQLVAGIIAGPLFIAVWAIQAFTREGFRPAFHPLSLLALGEQGWVQIANFVVTGLLYIVFATGMRRLLHPGRAGTWAPILVALVGVGLVVAGVFTTDPGAGFPVGAPAGAPVMSWHGAVHEVGFVLTQVGSRWSESAAGSLRASSRPWHPSPSFSFPIWRPSRFVR